MEEKNRKLVVGVVACEVTFNDTVELRRRLTDKPELSGLVDELDRTARDRTYPVAVADVDRRGLLDELDAWLDEKQFATPTGIKVLRNTLMMQIGERDAGHG